MIPKPSNPAAVHHVPRTPPSSERPSIQPQVLLLSCLAPAEALLTRQGHGQCTSSRKSSSASWPVLFAFWLPLATAYRHCQFSPYPTRERLWMGKGSDPRLGSLSKLHPTKEWMRAKWAVCGYWSVIGSGCTLRKATMKMRLHPGGTAGSTRRDPTSRRERELQSSGPSTGQDSSCSLRTNCHPGVPRPCSMAVPCTAQFIPEDFPELGVADRSTMGRAKQAGPA